MGKYGGDVLCYRCIEIFQNENQRCGMQMNMMSRGCHERTRSRTKGREYCIKKTTCLSYNPLTRADRNAIEDLSIYADQSSSDIFQYQKRFDPGTGPQ